MTVWVVIAFYRDMVSSDVFTFLAGVLDEAIWRVAAINQNRTATRQIGLHRCFAVFRRFRSLQ